MAKITHKNINDLSDWNTKELRKLKIMCKNRLSALKNNPNNEAASSHILYNLNAKALDLLVVNIARQEKILNNS